MRPSGQLSRRGVWTRRRAPVAAALRSLRRASAGVAGTHARAAFGVGRPSCASKAQPRGADSPHSPPAREAGRGAYRPRRGGRYDFARHMRAAIGRLPPKPPAQLCRGVPPRCAVDEARNPPRVCRAGKDATYIRHGTPARRSRLLPSCAASRPVHGGQVAPVRRAPGPVMPFKGGAGGREPPAAPPAADVCALCGDATDVDKDDLGAPLKRVLSCASLTPATRVQWRSRVSETRATRGGATTSPAPKISSSAPRPRLARAAGSGRTTCSTCGWPVRAQPRVDLSAVSDARLRRALLRLAPAGFRCIHLDSCTGRIVSSEIQKRKKQVAKAAAPAPAPAKPAPAAKPVAKPAAPKAAPAAAKPVVLVAAKPPAAHAPAPAPAPLAPAPPREPPPGAVWVTPPTKAAAQPRREKPAAPPAALPAANPWAGAAAADDSAYGAKAWERLAPPAGFDAPPPPEPEAAPPPKPETAAQGLPPWWIAEKEANAAPEHPAPPPAPQQPPLPLPLPLYLPPAPAAALPPLPPWLLGGGSAVSVPIAVPLPLPPEAFGPPAATSAEAFELAELRAERDAAVAEVAALRALCAAQRERLHALRG